jgi:hypothetical protein
MASTKRKKPAKPKATERWVAGVTTDSTHPPPGLLIKGAATVARNPGFKESFAEGSGFGHANAQLLH